VDKKSYDCAMWMREKCGIETFKESLDYSQKQNSQAQAEIVRLKKDLANSRRLLRNLMNSLDWDHPMYAEVSDELAKE
jgi:hypothetical protein